ncbi:MAG TPA: IPT/TIG domain-containing protein, partial [Solirubrobacteraceae bacterium]|nr:IPT/TIG domain-containing protein [Solirubrobacteraceae bacterium]
APGEETATAYTNSHRVCDKADNCAEAGALGPIEIDRKAPTISIATPVNGVEVAHGASLKAQYTCTDGGSGVSTCEGSTPSGTVLDTTTLGEHTLTVSSTDAVGNHSSASATYTVVQSDTTPPSISITSPEDGEIVNTGTKLTATYSCSDSDSGVASCEGSVPSGASLDTSAPGEYMLSVAASDVAGNVSSRTVHYTVVVPGECGESARLCETGLGDETPPSVVGLTLSPSSVDTSTAAKSVTVALRATDDLSGVSAVEVNLSNGSRWIGASANLTGGTRLDGTWDATLTLPKGSAEGSYALSVAVIDNIGNHHTYSAHELEALGFPSALTETGAGDTTPPQLSGASVTPASVSTCGSPASTTIGVQASDGSGVAYVTAYLTGPGGQSLSAPATLDGGSATSGHWSASLTLPQHAEQGSWSISIQAGDTAGNSTYVSSAQLGAAGFASAVQQTCAGDTSPPHVAGVTLSPETIDTSAAARSVVVAVHATDDLSGVASLQATLTSGGQSQSASASLQSGGTALDGTWQATISLPRWSQQGTWQLSLAATDQVGNTVSLSPSQITALGLPDSIVQTGEGDDTPPTASNGSISPNAFDTSQHSVSVSVHLHAADDKSGTELVRVEFTSPSGTQHVYGEANVTSGTPQEGEWTATLEFPQFSQQGSWSPRLELWDAFGNRRVYTPAELTTIFPPVGVAEKQAPKITKLSVKKGPAAGGTAVTITGEEFLGVSAIRFGSEDASSFTVDSSMSITAIAPPGTSGNTYISVTTPYGTSAQSNKARFKYEHPTAAEIAPANGPITGGTTVTIHGSGFAPGAGNTSFAFGTAEATTVDCSSTTTCTAVAPAAKKASTVDVLAKVGKAKSKKAPPSDQYTYG